MCQNDVVFLPFPTQILPVSYTASLSCPRQGSSGGRLCALFGSVCMCALVCMPMLVHVCVRMCGVCSLVCLVCVVDAEINTWKEGMVCSFLVSPLSGLRMFLL